MASLKTINCATADITVIVKDGRRFEIRKPFNVRQPALIICNRKITETTRKAADSLILALA